MTFEELLDWAALEDERARALFGKDADDVKWGLVRISKITEEVGELADEVLGASGMQRKAKVIERNEDDLGAEVADVLLTTLMLAKVMGVDVRAALKSKMAKVDKRYEVQV